MHTLFCIFCYFLRKNIQACANKCVFCWRHHTNPVGTEWRWEMEDPVEILEGAIDKHRKMMKANKGVPGVEEERLKDAMNVRHCALSLVGEPIMFFDCKVIFITKF